MKKHYVRFIAFLLLMAMMFEGAVTKTYALDESDFVSNHTTSEESTYVEEVAEEVFETKFLACVGNLSAKLTDSNAIALTWNEVENADGYIVKRRIGGGTFEVIGNVTDGMFIDENGSDEEYNFYRVYPYYEENGVQVIGESDAYVYAKATLKAVTNLKASSYGKGKVYLKWSSVKGADGYVIYRQVGQTKFEELYVTSSTSYVDTKASGTEYNFYRVYPYYMKTGKRILGPSNAYVYAKGIYNLKAVTNLKASAKAEKSVKLSWNGVDGADGYIVYKKVGDAAFGYMTKTSSLTCVDNTASETEYNFYRVYPYYEENGQNIVGPSDSYVYAKGIRPMNPVTNLKAAMVYAGRVDLKWNASKNVDGYMIYRRIGNGSFEYLGMTSQTTFKDEYPSETEYNFYRVYPYYTSGGSKIMGTSNSYVYSKGKVVSSWYTFDLEDSVIPVGRYYYNENGKRVYGKQVIDGKIYVFDSKTGVLLKMNGVRVLDPNKPMVALTFDDGPSSYTPRILNKLEEYGQAATFFVVGDNADRYRSTIARAYSIGCEIGNHTYSHPDLTDCSYSEIVRQMSRVDSIIYSATGRYSTVMRPPYGSYNSTVRNAVDTPIILWSIDTLDWQTRDTWSTVNCVLDNVEDGDIVLMHDIHSPTVAAAEILIPKLVARGYQLVTVTELAYYRGNGMQNGSVYYGFY